MKKIFYTYFNEDNIDIILESLVHKNEYTCIIPYITKDSDLLISRVCYQLLKNIKLDYYHQPISIIINELILRLNKLNVFNEFIQDKQLDIDNIVDYEKALKEYKNIYDSFMKKGSNNPKRSFIKIDITIDSGLLDINVSNGYSSNQRAISKIESSIKYANHYKNFEEVYRNNPEIYKDENLGLMLAVLMLKNINIKATNLFIQNEINKTQFNISIPLNELSDIHAERITDDIINEIRQLPQFPDSILKLQKELTDPEWNFKRITDFVMSDSSLAVEVLRIVNSPVYNNSTKIDNIELAVKKIGINGLNGILYSHGTMKVLESRYDIKKINFYKEHLFQVALISSYIAKKYNLDEFAEDIYISGLMHDIGKIIINALNPNIKLEVQKVAEKRIIPTDLLDDLTEGYNHSVIGSELLKKWNFPEKFINTIKFHHQPLKIDDKFKFLAYSVYLGNEINMYYKKNTEYRYIDIDILKYFDLDSKCKFDSFIKELKKESILF